MVETQLRVETRPTLETRRMTEAEFRLLEDDGYKHELVDGEDVRVPTSWTHDGIIMRLGFLLYPMAAGLGAFSCGQAGSRTGDGNVLVPDLRFFRAERLPNGEAPNDFSEGAPDLCVEVISPLERSGGIFRKIGEYFDAGAQLVWIVRPDRQTVAVYSPDMDVWTFRGEEELSLPNIVPGFSCAVTDLFSK